MIVLNFFGGPGIRKSSFASLAHYTLKELGYNVEIASEYAKELVISEDHEKLADQLYVTAKQNRRLERVRNKVDIVISDCPLLLGIEYATPEYLGGFYKQMVLSLFDTYENENILLNRTTSMYDVRGRLQTLEEAKVIDKSIKDMLDSYDYNYQEVDNTKEAVEDYIRKRFPSKH